MLTGFGWHLECDLRQVNDHAIRIGEREGGKIDFPIQVDHDPGLFVVAANAHIGRDRGGLGRHRRCVHGHAAIGGDGDRVAQHRAGQCAGYSYRAGCHESGPFGAAF